MLMDPHLSQQHAGLQHAASLSTTTGCAQNLVNTQFGQSGWLTMTEKKQSLGLMPFGQQKFQ